MFVADVMAHEQEIEMKVLPNNIVLFHAKSSVVKTLFIAIPKNSTGVVWNNNKVKLSV
ncbi:PTS sugar transporter subunit IIA [Gilliamella sp. wkB108]|uniref:PTS sugar transporter subunit IIA n=1 Tax=Gilliamella sp. wkB108 TaxID=3120256 RepID=UPI0009C02C84|nr:PTS sugar transporter subunit IIA [Gilliamella apicola]